MPKTVICFFSARRLAREVKSSFLESTHSELYSI